jgi:kynurenine formamidase
MPLASGVDALDSTRRITASDLAEALRRQGQTIRDGDAVLIRTGRPLGRFVDIDRPEFLRYGVPGPDDSAARWLAENHVSVAGSDTLAFEWLAPDRGLSRLPAHNVLLVEHGIPIIEFMNLEELAQARTWEFVFVAAPLRIVGGTGSPIRPLAIVREG